MTAEVPMKIHLKDAQTVPGNQHDNVRDRNSIGSASGYQPVYNSTWSVDGCGQAKWLQPGSVIPVSSHHRSPANQPAVGHDANGGS